MERNQTVTASLVALDDYQRINQRFIQGAIEEWDKVGSGCFAGWIKLVVAVKWLELVRSN